MIFFSDPVNRLAGVQPGSSSEVIPDNTVGSILDLREDFAGI